MEESPVNDTTDYDHFHALMRKRMSIRSLKSDPIPDDYIQKVLEAGRWAMSGANAQPWEFMVIRDPDVRRKVFDAFHESSTDFVFWMEQIRQRELRHPAYMFEGDPHEQWEKARSGMIKTWWKAPAMIVILGDGRRQWATVQAAMTFGRHPSHLTDALSNAATMMHLAAASLGLGSQHVTIHIEEPIKRVLGIPDLLMVHHILPMGFSAIDRRPGVRRPLEDVVHYDHYDMDKYMSNEDILKFLQDLRVKTKGGYGR
jgi:5,6-dimethylbenzimidazole synthase